MTPRLVAVNKRGGIPAPLLKAFQCKLHYFFVPVQLPPGFCSAGAFIMPSGAFIMPSGALTTPFVPVQAAWDVVAVAKSPAPARSPAMLSPERIFPMSFESMFHLLFGRLVTPPSISNSPLTPS
jgi:hypothetical protein